jgi:hypothetical protein
MLKTITIKSAIPIGWGEAEIAPFLGGHKLVGLCANSTHSVTVELAEPITEAQADALVEGVRQHVIANLVARAP